jgi:hypothetical protein
VSRSGSYGERILSKVCRENSSPRNPYQLTASARRLGTGRGWVCPYRRGSEPPCVKFQAGGYCTPQIKIFAKVKLPVMSDLI